jgi:hypothetical protein
LIYDPREWEIEEEEAISHMKTEELDRLVAAGEIRDPIASRSGSLCAVLFSLLNDPMVTRERGGKGLTRRYRELVPHCELFASDN